MMDSKTLYCQHKRKKRRLVIVGSSRRIPVKRWFGWKLCCRDCGKLLETGLTTPGGIA